MDCSRRTAIQLFGVTAATPAIAVPHQVPSLARSIILVGLGEFLQASESIVVAALRRIEPELAAAGILCWEAGAQKIHLVTSEDRREIRLPLSEGSAAMGARFAALACAGAVRAVSSGGAVFRNAGECDLGTARVGLYGARFATLGVLATGLGRSGMPVAIGLGV